MQVGETEWEHPPCACLQGQASPSAEAHLERLLNDVGQSRGALATEKESSRSLQVRPPPLNVPIPAFLLCLVRWQVTSGADGLTVGVTD